ncbi:MAG: hypothetical protein A3J37_06670 [Alphaproteobacteria bacterium RIFCSPHIGHO2_12_FULL_45_9]|nr:MAG: hypothetical protein A3B66_04175 [Alphaproteobacteria bacterium RIFCSPHIGHO2_02_FULL_46_13]OFW98876.1 MAG: hypothetical protein A3J37_06670 [Alphaproteobacteria bacterium RIFCSPHIGHO2_12_FULL_45_9]
MPSIRPIIAPAEQHIVTNKSLIETPNPDFILSGKLSHDGVSEDGNTQLAFTIQPTTKAVHISHSITEALSSGAYHEPVEYFSRDEIQGDIESEEAQKLSSDTRLLRVMPILTLQQGDRQLINLTLRDNGASNAGSWGCASSMVSGKITTRSIFASLNKETGLLIDGKIVILVPDDASEDEKNNIYSDAANIKLGNGKKVPELANAWSRTGAFEVISAKLTLPKQPDIVSFYGGVLEGDKQCQAFDNEKAKTLTLIFPYVAQIDNQAALSAFNSQGYQGPATIVDKSSLSKGTKMPLIPGLSQFVYGK